MGYLLCVYNPLSGSGSVMARLPDLEAVIKDAGFEHLKLELIDPEFKSKLCRYIRDKEIDTIMGIGGDGTHNSIINTLIDLQSEELDLTIPPYALCPFGTGNDVPKSLGMKAGDEHFKELVNTAMNGAIFRMDMGLAMGQRFADMFSIGMDTRILGIRDRMITNYLKRHKDKRGRLYGYYAYAFAVLKSVFNVDVLSGEIRVDNELFYKGKFVNLIINNCRVGAGHFDLTPMAYLNDGKLDMLIVRNRLAYLWRYLFALSFNTRKMRRSDDAAIRIQTANIHIKLDKETDYQVDGELMDKTAEIEISCLQTCIDVRVDEDIIAQIKVPPELEGTD